MTNYHEPNSRKAKEANEVPDKVIEKVIASEVVQRKKPVGRRFKEIFFGGEFRSASRYVATEVLLPAARNLVFDATTESAKRMIYGDSFQRRAQPDGRSRISYNSPLTQRPDPRADMRPPGQPPRPLPSRTTSTEIILHSRADAEIVLERLADILETYQVASVADLNELVGLPSSHVDNRWGWTYLANSGIRQVREGFVLELPPTEPI
jgi:hypothetical protein